MIILKNFKWYRRWYGSRWARVMGWYSGTLVGQRWVYVPYARDELVEEIYD